MLQNYSIGIVKRETYGRRGELSWAYSPAAQSRISIILGAFFGRSHELVLILWNLFRDTLCLNSFVARV